jgi:hypothetical protein
MKVGQRSDSVVPCGTSIVCLTGSPSAKAAGLLSGKVRHSLVQGGRLEDYDFRQFCFSHEA